MLRILVLARRCVEADTFVRAGRFIGGSRICSSVHVNGWTLGLAGFGRIGRAIGRASEGHGGRVGATATG